MPQDLQPMDCLPIAVLAAAAILGIAVHRAFSPARLDLAFRGDVARLFAPTPRAESGWIGIKLVLAGLLLFACIGCAFVAFAAALG